jgi:hypothetical protein
MELLNDFARFKQGYLQEKEAKNVIRRVHPDNEDVVILTYSDRCIFGKHWNEITRICRELIVNEATGEILALSLPKFFNPHETSDIQLVMPDPNEAFEATKKLDGIQAENYRLNGKMYWAADGKFNSPAAAIAQSLWDEKYADKDIPDHLTLIVEVIHPETEMVCHYDFTDLVLVAVLDRLTGEDYTYDAISFIAKDLGMPMIEKVEGTFAELQARVEQLDHTEEGFVVRLLGDQKINRIKLKSKKYLRVLRVVKLMSERQKAELWMNGEIDAAIDKLPQEFKHVLISRKNDYENAMTELSKNIQANFDQAPKETKKDFALWIQANNISHSFVLFPLFEGKNVDALLRRAVYQDFYEK